jgi:hypothetical protein
MPSALITGSNRGLGFEFARQYLASCIGLEAAAAALSFGLLPPISPALRTRHLLAFALTDLRHLAISSSPPPLEDWEKRMYVRLAAMPDTAKPVQRAQLMARTRGRSGNHATSSNPCGAKVEERQLGAALAALLRRDSEIAVRQLATLDRRLASLRMRIRKRISRCERAPDCSFCRKSLPNMLITLMRDCPHEVHRD